MTRSLFILTGASRGMGAAIADQLLRPNTVLLCVSRTLNPSLSQRAAAAGAQVEQWQRDLADPAPVAQALLAWLQTFEPTRFDEASLINNAGVMTRVGPVDECTFAELSMAMRAGVEAPMLLSAAFLLATRGWRAQRKLLNISSGLARRAMAGAAPYCAAKAGMDHLSRAMALDEVHRGSGVKIVSLAPGVIDTDMQVQLRAADRGGFPELGNFVKLQSAGQLASAADAAAKVLAYLRRADFGLNPVADVRDS
jgi:benzil reductase ((S)-benzoin forming)